MTTNRMLAAITTIYLLVSASAIASPSAISVSEVLKNPEKYLNKEITVEGFTKIRFEDVNIYANQNDLAQCLSLLVPTKSFEQYKAKFDGKVVTLRGTLTSPACPEGSLCNWICNDKYGLKVSGVAF